jgi:transposase
MRDGLFWLSDGQWMRIEGFLSLKRKGAHRVDDRRVISGIIHVIQTGMPWRAVPSEYGPAKTVYNRFYRWSLQGMWIDLFALLVKAGDPLEIGLIDGTLVRVHQTATAQKGGAVIRPWAKVAGAEPQRYMLLPMSDAVYTALP